MTKASRPGPRKITLQYADYVRNMQRELGNTPVNTCVLYIRSYGADIKSGKYFNVKRIIEYVIGSGYKEKVIEAARKALADISPEKLVENPFKRFGYEKRVEPSILGTLFEVLPQAMAVRLFLEKYLLDKKTSILEASDNAGQTLLSFSAPDQAARFFKALKQKGPKEADQIIQDMGNYKTIYEYRYLRYEVNKLFKKLELPLIPASKSRPKARKTAKTARKKTSKRKKAPTKGKAPITEKAPEMVKAPELTLEDQLKVIDLYRDSISKNFHYVVSPLLEIVIDMDFDPQIVSAAKKALSPITSYQKTPRPFEKFSLSGNAPPTLLLGALFELLPEATALKVFRTEFLDAGDFFQITYSKAGRSLLRFSSARKAAAFIHALIKDTGSDLEKFLLRCRKSDKIREYPHRRYEVAEMLSALKKMEKGHA
jgi:hypothetical protein